MDLAGLTAGSVLLAGAAAVGTLAAQEASLRVVVRGAEHPLGGAGVTVGALTRRTDAGGEVRFSLAAGDYLIRVTRIGWRPDSIPIGLRAGLDTTVTVTLEELAAELEELVVSSTRTGRRVEDQPLRVEVLDTEEVEEKLLMTPGDVVMLLNETGGVRVATTNPSLGGAAIRMQGMRGRYTQVLADGLPLFGERAGTFGPLQIPPMDLGQVEIIKGVASALFGGSALGGVVNLISRRPEPGYRSLLVNGTTLGGTDLTGFGAGELGGGWGYTLLGGWHRQGRRDRDGDGWTDVAGYDRQVLRPRVFWEDGAGQSLLVTAGATVEERSGGTLPGRVAPDGAPFGERVSTTRVDGGGVGRWRLGDGRWLLVRGSAVSLEHRHRFGTVVEPDRHRTLFAEAAVTQRIGRTDLLGGAAVLSDRYRAEAFPAMDFDYLVPGAFAQVEHTVSDRLGLAASARVDHHDRYGTFLSPRLSVVAKPGERWTARISGGTGFYGPSPLTDETERVGLSRLDPPTGLRAERARSGSLDLGYSLPALDLHLTGFLAEVDHAVQLRDAAPDRVALTNAAGPTRSAGFDVLARVRRDRVTVTASYTFVSATEPEPNGPGRRTVPLTPRHAAGLVAVYEAEETGRAGLELYFTGPQTLEPNPYRSASESYLVVGILVERALGPVRTFLNLENLTGVRQTRFDPLVLPARAPDGRWTIDAWAPLDGRVINGGIRLRW